MSDAYDEGEESPSERTAIKHSHVHPNAPKEDNFLKWKYPRRYLVAFMAFLGFSNIYALRVNLSVAIVAMTTSSSTFKNDTEYHVPADFNWSPNIQGLVLSSFFYGYIVTQIPAGYLSAKYGGRRILGLGVAGTSILTLFTPIFAYISLYLLLTARVLEGLLQGVTYPAMYAVWSRWAPPLERSKLATIAFCGSYFGTFVALLVSGFLADNLGWPSIFVIFGAFGCIWAVFWSILVAEFPREDKFITAMELQYIESSIGTSSVKKNEYIPWKKILRSLPVWAIIVAHFCENWGFYTLLTELPTFMTDVLQIKLQRAGIMAAAPFLAMGILLVSSGVLADKLRVKKCFSTVVIRKSFTVLGFLIQGIFIMCVAIAKNIQELMVYLVLAVAFGGLAWSGFGVNHLDVAPPYASILMGISNTFATLPGIIGPVIAGVIVQNKSQEEWAHVFLVSSLIYGFGALFYVIFASGDEQPWTRPISGLLSDDLGDTDSEELNFRHTDSE